jgi:uncharacterized repeat protein (TIGR03803 family)
MKIHFNCLSLFAVLMAGLSLILTNKVTAQTFTTLHTFTAVAGIHSTNNDGDYVLAGLILSGNTLYGTAGYGGTNGWGTVFALNTNGSSFITLHTFTAVAGIHSTNSEGAVPEAGLILSGDNLYGTAAYGGTNGTGTVFALNTNSSSYITLHTFGALVGFSTSDGYDPQAGLVLSGNTLYGTAFAGDTNGGGAVFAVSTNGSNYINLHNFTAVAGFNSTNSDGSQPYAGLVLSANTLYGTAEFGGTNGWGTVFAVSINGSNYITLHNFSAEATNNLDIFTNSDGSLPYAGLVLSGNTLYGTTARGGTNGSGTVFSVSTNGSSFITLHNFSAEATNSLDIFTNSDGYGPQAGLILSGSTLYGTAVGGGTNGRGTVFALNTNGSNFITLHTFSAEATNSLDIFTNSDGAGPNAGLILSGNTLYGTASAGGTNGSGTVFSLTAMLPVVPQLAIALSGANVILTWPTNAAGFSLESATNLVPPVVWSTNSTAPVVINANNAVTNGISGTQKFYRLSQ